MKRKSLDSENAHDWSPTSFKKSKSNDSGGLQERKPNVIRILKEKNFNICHKQTTERQKKKSPTVEKKECSFSQISAKALKSFRFVKGVRDCLTDLLPPQFRQSSDNLACFAKFITERQDITVRRTVDPSLQAPFTENEILSQYFFTNVNRELDVGTRFLRSSLFSQYEDLKQGTLMDVFFQLALYRSFNKGETFKKFGGIPFLNVSPLLKLLYKAS